MTGPRRLARPLLPLALLAAALTLAACGRPGVAEAQGAVTFPASAPPEAHGLFLEGVERLHRFDYARAREAFARARAVAPGFALAHWGEALTHVHPLWTEEDLPAARAALAALGPTPEARAAQAPTPRERAWLAAVEALVGPGSPPERHAAHERAMADLAQRHPDDVEAQAFHALAILGTAGGVRDRAVYDRAAAILEPLMGSHPRHPGVLHYLIHCWDDAEHARRALPAARALAEVAGDSSHTLHMPSHVFLALGLWEETAASNRAAWAASGRTNHHALYWLAYARLQQGRAGDARRHLADMEADAAGSAGGRERTYLALMRAAHLVDAPACDADVLAIRLPLDGLAADVAGAYHVATGLCAWRAGEAAGVEAARQALAVALAAPLPGGDRNLQRAHAVAAVAHGLLGALAADLAGRTDEALAGLRTLAGREDAIPEEFGPPNPPKPAAELLGDLLVAHDRPGEAIEAYRAALDLAPRRRAALDGLLRAATAAGDEAAAGEAREALAAIDARAGAAD